jgi:glycosyltransferase involved in cell wall biosynthesis/spore maturation protein CgeB
MADMRRWRVILLDTKRSNPNHYICLSIEEALRAHSLVDFVHRASMGDALAVAREQGCNLFLAFDGEELHPGLCDRLRAVCGLAVLWITEDPYELPVNLKSAPLFDVIFTNDTASVAAYRGRAHHLPLAGSPRLQHHPVATDADCLYDLFFAGTAWPNRVELLRELSHALAEVKVKFALSTNPHLPPVELDLPPSAFSWRTPNSEFARLANRSRAVLTLHRDFSTSPGAPTTAATPGPRLFEVALAGGFQLVDGSLPEVARYFVPGEEIAVFHGTADCVEKLRHYLTHPEERVRMARAAQERALREHTYSNRVATILELAEQGRPVVAARTLTPAAARPRVLMVTHNTIGGRPWGGVEVYQEWIRQSLADRFEVWTYAPVTPEEGCEFSNACVLLDDQLRQVERPTFGTLLGTDLLTCPEREAAFSRVLQRHGFALVHFQHVLHHPPSLPLIAKALGMPTVWSLHDYYGLCHRFNLLGVDGRYCGVERQTEAGCDLCLSQTMGAQRGSQATRRAFYRRALASATVLHANTEGVRQRHESVYGGLRQHNGWEIMGVPIAPSGKNASAVTHMPATGRLQVAIPGNFVPHKGAELLVNVFRQLRDEPIDFLIFGRIEKDWAERLQKAGNPNVTVYGAYDPTQAEELLQRAQVSLHVSNWPETYCLTLSEALRAGLVPVVTDIGALGERVRHGVNGLKFPPDEPGRLVEILTELAEAPGEVERLRRGASGSDFVDHETHHAWLAGMYERLVQFAPPVPPAEGEVYPVHLADCGVILNQPVWFSHDFDRPRLTPSEPPPRVSVPVRILRYVARHGVGATLRRACRELVTRVRRTPHN